MNHRWITPISPNNLSDESVAADLFGDFDEPADAAAGGEIPVAENYSFVGIENAVPSRDVADSSELRLDVDDDAAESDPVLVQAPRALSSPSQPTAEEIAQHWLTHLPYRSWCKFCVAAKRGNAPHRFCHLYSREIPLLVADYCYVRDSRDDDLLTIFVGRLYPSRVIVAIPCDVKGPDDFATHRLANFLRDCGVTRLAYLCDQEKPLNAMIRTAMGELGGDAEWKGAIPENSAVGESQSNGKAEAAVKALEDQVRVMKAALESRVSARIPSMHPVMRWMVEYAATILNKYHIQSTGRTAYHDLHWQSGWQSSGKSYCTTSPRRSDTSSTCAGAPVSSWGPR